MKKKDFIKKNLMVRLRMAHNTTQVRNRPINIENFSRNILLLIIILKKNINIKEFIQEKAQYQQLF